MKNIIIGILALISVALAGCGEQSSKKSNDTAETIIEQKPQVPQISEEDKLKAELAKLNKNEWLEKILEDRKYYDYAIDFKILASFTFDDFNKIEVKYPTLKKSLNSWRIITLKKDNFPDIENKTIGDLFSEKFEAFNSIQWSVLKDKNNKKNILFSAYVVCEGYPSIPLFIKFRYNDENKLEYSSFTKDGGFSVPVPKEMLLNLLKIFAVADDVSSEMEDFGF